MKILPCPVCEHQAVIPYGVRFFRRLLRRSDLYVCLVCGARVNYDRAVTWTPDETFVGLEEM